MRAAVLALSLLGGVGCHRLLPFSSQQESTRDQRAPVADAAGSDQPREAPWPREAAPGDASRAEDAPALVDHRPADQAKLDWLADACAASAGTMSMPGWASSMRGCVTAPDTYDQCSAEQLCRTSAGWHLCSATEYKARGGLTTSTSGVVLWLGGCSVRLASSMQPLADGSCTCAAVLDPVPASANFSCNGTTGAANYLLSLGASTNGSCHSITGLPADQAYWLGIAPTTKLGGAMCCK